MKFPKSTLPNFDFIGKYTARCDSTDYTLGENNGKVMRPWATKSALNKNESIQHCGNETIQFFYNNFDKHRVHPIFSELEVLTTTDRTLHWKERARWIKFEEDVEEGGNRWSKPFVGSLMLPSLYHLQDLLLTGLVMLNTEGFDFEEIVRQLCENLIEAGILSMQAKYKVRDVLLSPHQHLGLPMENDREKLKTQDLVLRPDKLRHQDERALGNKRLMRKIPSEAEACNILIGEVEFLEQPLSAFVRLAKPVILENLTEIPVPTRFIYIVLGPKINRLNYLEIGRAVATLMSDEVFREYAYRGQQAEHLVAGVNEFLDAASVIPPRAWDPSIRLEPPASVSNQERSKRPPDHQNQSTGDRKDFDEAQQRAESGLVWSGRLFGGLMNDIKRKAPWYFSDFKDAFNLQCVASWIFLYFACLAPIITFGGLLSEATGKNIAAIESLVSGFICGIGYGLFSGQPLAILGSTGPVLVFESIVYGFCQSHDLDYLSFRFWIGTWIAVILLVMTAFDASAAVCYITRFTEENFATLIAFIFIFKAIENVASIRNKFPLHNPYSDCICMLPEEDNTSSDITSCLSMNGTLVGDDCLKPESTNIFLMSLILFLGTFIISIVLKSFKSASCFPTCVRQFISDFAVIIAILTMSTLDFFMQIATPKLEVPSELKPTLPTRDWFVNPLEANPPWTAAAAILPALLGTILIFMDQQITAVIINRRENKLKKGCGYHLDLFILAILIQICSIMGLPWFVAATVLSLNHVNSLKKESECSAPGEKPQFLGVREQRVTQILIFFTIGFSVLLTPLLRHIPMPVLFGVFLYMGVASLSGLQFFERILIIFMPLKYQPDHEYLRQIPIKRVHLFTIIQLACLVALWIVKSFHQTSIFFPLMLVVMVGIRKALDSVFTQRELKILDDIMPNMRPKSNPALESTRRISLKASNDEGGNGNSSVINPSIAPA